MSKGKERAEIFITHRAGEQFDRPIIEWQRQADFQTVFCVVKEPVVRCNSYRDQIPTHLRNPLAQVVLIDICAAILSNCPAYTKLSTPPEIYVPGDISHNVYVFKAQTVLFVSAYNPGAVDMAEEIVAHCAAGASDDVQPTSAGLEIQRGTRQSELLISDDSKDHSRSQESSEALSEAKFHVHQIAGTNVRKLIRAAKKALGPGQNLISEHNQATHMLLYLNKETFVGSNGHELANELRLAQRRMQIILVHETDETRSGCTLDHLLKHTPEDLISGGLYSKLAIPSKSGSLRAVSLSMMAKALGAVPMSSTQRRKRLAVQHVTAVNQMLTSSSRGVCSRLA